MRNHVAIIPARAGSQGFPGKNRIFFDFTCAFLEQVPWITRVIVSTDDPVIMERARERGYELHQRPEHLAGAAVSIKDVYRSVIDDMGCGPDDMIWLLYLTVLYKNPADFERARELAENPETESIMSFIPASVHPWCCWQWDETAGRLSQYIENDAFRRQDRPQAWRYYHYLVCCRPRALQSLNSELIGAATTPIFLDDQTASLLVEIDTPEEWAEWKRRQQQP